jgi:cytochrome oxidase assembly protein ShyY1
VIDRGYLEKLRQRAKKSRVSRKFQLEGLEIAGILKDEKHKSLYIKLAKEMNPEKLRRLAKEIAENKNVKNKGAYFMALLKSK